MEKNQRSEDRGDQRPVLRDYIMVVNMVLFFVVGPLLLIRSTNRIGELVGILFLFLGTYRLYLFWTRRGVWRQKFTR